MSNESSVPQQQPPSPVVPLLPPTEAIQRFQYSMESLARPLKSIVFGAADPLVAIVTEYDFILQQLAIDQFRAKWSDHPPTANEQPEWEFVTTTVIFHELVESERFLFRLMPAGTDSVTRMVARLRLGAVGYDPELTCEEEVAEIRRILSVPLSSVTATATSCSK